MSRPAHLNVSSKRVKGGEGLRQGHLSTGVLALGASILLAGPVALLAAGGPPSRARYRGGPRWPRGPPRLGPRPSAGRCVRHPELALPAFDGLVRRPREGSAGLVRD